MTQQFGEYGVSVGVVAVFRFSANKALGDLHAKFDEHFKFADYLLVPRVLHRILRELSNVEVTGGALAPSSDRRERG